MRHQPYSFTLLPGFICSLGWYFWAGTDGLFMLSTGRLVSLLVNAPKLTDRLEKVLAAEDLDFKNSEHAMVKIRRKLQIIKDNCSLNQI